MALCSFTELQGHGPWTYRYLRKETSANDLSIHVSTSKVTREQRRDQVLQPRAPSLKSTCPQRSLRSRRDLFLVPPSEHLQAKQLLRFHRVPEQKPLRSDLSTHQFSRH